MSDLAESSTSTPPDPAPRTTRAQASRDPKAVLKAAHAVESLSWQSLAAVAETKGITLQQLRARLDRKLLELAEGGDVQAIAMLSERVAGIGLGRIECCRSAKSMHRRVMRAWPMGASASPRPASSPGW